MEHLTDEELRGLGVETIGERARLRSRCKATAGVCVEQKKLVSHEFDWPFVYLSVSCLIFWLAINAQKMASGHLAVIFGSALKLFDSHPPSLSLLPSLPSF